MAVRREPKRSGRRTADTSGLADSKLIGRVRAIALGLPETLERSVHGTPGFYVRKKLFVWVLGDGESIAVWMDLAERETRVASQPETFVVTPHYEKHPMVLVRLHKATPPVLEQVIAARGVFERPRRSRQGTPTTFGSRRAIASSSGPPSSPSAVPSPPRRRPPCASRSPRCSRPCPSP
jgi:hypothetical protein